MLPKCYIPRSLIPCNPKGYNNNSLNAVGNFCCSQLRLGYFPPTVSPAMTIRKANDTISCRDHRYPHLRSLKYTTINDALNNALRPHLLDRAGAVPTTPAVRPVGKEEVGPALLREPGPLPVVRISTVAELVIGADCYFPCVTIIYPLDCKFVIHQT